MQLRNVDNAKLHNNTYHPKLLCFFSYFEMFIPNCAFFEPFEIHFWMTENYSNCSQHVFHKSKEKCTEQMFNTVKRSNWTKLQSSNTRDICIRVVKLKAVALILKMQLSLSKLQPVEFRKFILIEKNSGNFRIMHTMRATIKYPIDKLKGTRSSDQ